MTNKDKFLKDGVVVEELWKKFQEYYYKNKRKESDVGKAFINFFEQQVKPTLTEDERIILKFIVANHKTIFRDKGGDLWTRDTNDEDWTFYQFEHLFQFIKNGEEYEIAELLKGEQE